MLRYNASSYTMGLLYIDVVLPSHDKYVVLDCVWAGIQEVTSANGCLLEPELSGARIANQYSPQRKCMAGVTVERLCFKFESSSATRSHSAEGLPNLFTVSSYSYFSCS